MALSRVLKTPSLAAALSVRSSTWAVAATSTSNVSAVRRYASDSHDDHHHHHDDGRYPPPKKEPIHKEEWLKLARNWPHEYHYPGNLFPVTAADALPTDNSGHSEANPTGAELLHKPESYFSGYWFKLALLVAAGAGVVQVNASWTANNPNTEHPLTSLARRFQSHFTAAHAHDYAAKWIAIRQQEADDRLILASGTGTDRPRRILFPGVFERASDYLIELGSQADVSDVKIKHTWQEDDDLFGPPYPKNK